jgi:hypothetical protein
LEYKVAKYTDFTYIVPDVDSGFAEIIYKDNYIAVQLSYYDSSGFKLHYYKYDENGEPLGIVNVSDNPGLVIYPGSKIMLAYVKTNKVYLMNYVWTWSDSLNSFNAYYACAFRAYYYLPDEWLSNSYDGVDLDINIGQADVGYNSSTDDFATIDTLNGLFDGVYDNTGALTDLSVNVEELTEQIELLQDVLADTNTPIESMPVEMSKWKIPNLLKTKFPFCIPFDLVNLLKQFNQTPEVPEFIYSVDLNVNEDVSVNIPFMDSTLIDFEPIAKVSRLLCKLFFIAGLMMVSRKVLII